MTAPVEPRIEIGRTELYTPQIEQALDVARTLRQRERPVPPVVAPWRRILLSSLFYLPLAGLLASLLTWSLIEPSFDDFSRVGGEVVLVNESPFEVKGISVTIGDFEAVVLPGKTRLEPGADGQPPLTDLSELKPGDLVEVVGVSTAGMEKRLLAFSIRPATREHATAFGERVSEELGWAKIMLFPLTAFTLALFLLFFEGFSTRNWHRTLVRCFLGTLLALGLSLVAFVPGGCFLTISQAAISEVADEQVITTLHTLPAWVFFLQVVCRSLAWACIGTALGVGMNLVRSTRAQLRNSAMGGALGGALGGLFFDPIELYLLPASNFIGAEASRLVGLIAVGLCVGLFIALVERLSREAWLLVRTGPLAGKAFVLYRSPTRVGSSPEAEVYLFKDPGIDGQHAAIHRVGAAFELEDLASRHGTRVNQEPVRRQRLQSGDIIAIGDTLLEFEERARRSPTTEG